MQSGSYLPVVEDGVYMNKKGKFMYYIGVYKNNVHLKYCSSWSVPEVYAYTENLDIFKTFRSILLLGVEDEL